MNNGMEQEKWALDKEDEDLLELDMFEDIH